MSAGKRLAVAGMLGFAFAAASTVSASAQTPPPCNAPFYGGACPGVGGGGGGSGGASAPTGATGGNLVAAAVGGGAPTPVVASSVTPGVAVGGTAAALAGGTAAALAGGTGAGTGGVGGGVLSTAGTGSAESLAFTGSATGPMVGVASLCLALGCGLVLLGRRREPIAAASRATDPMSTRPEAPVGMVRHTRIRRVPEPKSWWERSAIAFAAWSEPTRVRLEAFLSAPLGSPPGWLNASPGSLELTLSGRSTGPPSTITAIRQVRTQHAVVFRGRSRPR